MYTDPLYDAPKKPRPMGDWVVVGISAACLLIALFILFQPGVLYYTVLVVGTGAKVLFWWTLAGVLCVAAINIIKKALYDDANRTRTHNNKETK